MVSVPDSSPVFTVQDLPDRRQTTGCLRQSPQVLSLPFKEGMKRAERDNAIDNYIGEDYMDVLADGCVGEISSR